MKIVAMVTVVAVLLNAMAPTLAHSAIYLQGVEVNANTLVQDAYVQVTYYDKDDEQKLAKGWIDAVGETTFTIRSGALFGKKTITYDKVLSVIMSDESNRSVKQMNEVNRFIQEMKKRESKQGEKEVKTGVEQIKSETNTEAIQRPNQTAYVRSGFITKTVTVMAREKIDPSKITIGWYAQVVYESKEGGKRTAAGQIVYEDTTRILVKDRIDRITTWTIAYDDIDTLAVAKQWSDIERYRESGAQYNARVRFNAPSMFSISKRRMVGELIKMKQDTLVIQRGRRFYEVSRSSISNLEVSIGQHRDERDIGIGLLIGVGLGIIIYVTQSPECPDPPTCTFAGLEELGALILAGGTVMISTLIGAKKSEKWVEVPLERLNLSLFPTSTKELRAELTFNF